MKTIGNVSCVVSSIEKNADGTLKKCTLSENKTVPGADLTCAANSSMTLNAEGTLEQCTLAFDRSYPDPTGVICDDGKTINLYPDGSLAKCTAVTEKKSALLGGTCAINSTVELYPDGQLRKCISNVEKKVPAAATADVHVTEFTCAAKSAIGFYTNGKVQQCTPTESVYMRGKGTCLPGEPATFQIDGKVQECTYTYPLYQNKSCKVESRVSFHPNGSFKDCTLPEDKSVGKAVCKADAAVSYRANGTIETCTLAAPVELAPGKSLPIGTVVTIDEKQVVAEKQATPAAPVAPPATPEKPVASATK
ncbi:MAG TPA: hypothetical protein VN631_14060 [Negativicutes bacterium]|nr:hypothetical protein [Negativicutes bacterium]